MRRWNLTEKIALFAGVFLLLSLLSVAGTLWISWMLQGGAGAVNVAGQLRMMSYRLELDRAEPGAPRVAGELQDMQRALDLLRDGQPERPLSVPWTPPIRQRFEAVQRQWRVLQPRWHQAAAASPAGRAELDRFVGDIDAFVQAIEQRLDFWTSLLHTAQMAMGGFVLVAFIAMFFVVYLHVLEPVGRLARGVEQVSAGDYSARVDVGAGDELGDLARGFNRMAAQLHAVYAELEFKVRDKTAALQTEQTRLRALYEISALVARAPNLEQLAQGFVGAMRRIAQADAAVLRWTDETAQRYLLLASEGMPQSFVGDERCLHAGSCHCGSPQPSGGAKVVHFGVEAAAQAADALCLREGFATLVAVPIRMQGRLLGELDLFYRDQGAADAQQQALLEALCEHLAAAMESLRGAALEREAAVTRERTLLARELHDSIAQALAFMKIQLQLLRTAMRAQDPGRVDTALSELDAGLRESTADVRELLLHFRTRAQEQDIEPALRSTLQKFEAQTGMPVRLQYNGHGQPLDADVQIQVLHVVQEALSNVRKHARANRVSLSVQSLPHWSFCIEDDGRGCDPEVLAADAQAHVGLQIMRERAAAIGAELQFESRPGQGATVRLLLPQAQPASAGAPAGGGVAA